MILPLTGYADRFSVHPGETIDFKISSVDAGAYDAELVRLISGDPNPAGPGLVEEAIPAPFAGRHQGRTQPVPIGSYGRIAQHAALDGLAGFTVMATIYPTMAHKQRQTVISLGGAAAAAGFALTVGPQGAGVDLFGAPAAMVETGRPFRRRAWYRVWASFDPASGRLRVGQSPLEPAFAVADAGIADRENTALTRVTGQPLLIAARNETDAVGNHYDGRIEAPVLYDRALTDEARDAAFAGQHQSGLVAAWDFAIGMQTTVITDIGPNGLHGSLVNLPKRAVKGARWSGREQCWRHAPEDYAAIHFHGDDLYDCGWQTDFSYQVPADLKTGVYAAKIRAGEGAYDHIPFFVVPRPGQATAPIAVLMPTYTYIIYSNIARGPDGADNQARIADWPVRPWQPNDVRDYGLSTYNYHRDGSGIAHASRLRPIMTMRPGYQAMPDAVGSGLRHLPADLQLLDWLEARGHAFDIITDEDLEAHGAALLAPYRVVMTPSHPEYHTAGTLDALLAYRDGGGRFLYLGGNGFYWRVARHADCPGVLEVRRAEGGIRAWAEEPGQYYHGFDGQYGGLWRRNGRPPQALVGIGFSSQGDFEGSYYRKTAAAADPRVAWMFDGIDGDILGDFGLGGGGAAGFELDRYDEAQGSPGHAVVVASSENHSPSHVVVPEDILNHTETTVRGSKDALIRSDITFFETPNGGAVFSVGSILFCGSLNHNRYDNSISRLVENVLVRFRDGDIPPPPKAD